MSPAFGGRCHLVEPENLAPSFQSSNGAACQSYLLVHTRYSRNHSVIRSGSAIQLNAAVDSVSDCSRSVVVKRSSFLLDNMDVEPEAPYRTPTFLEERRSLAFGIHPFSPFSRCHWCSAGSFLREKVIRTQQSFYRFFYGARSHLGMLAQGITPSRTSLLIQGPLLREPLHPLSGNGKAA